MKAYLNRLVKSDDLKTKTQAIAVFNLFICPFVIVVAAVILCKTSNPYLAGMTCVLLVYSVCGIVTNLLLLRGNKQDYHLFLLPHMANSLITLPIYYWEPFFYHIILSRYKGILEPRERRLATGVHLKSRANQLGILKLVLSTIILCTGVTLQLVKVVPMNKEFKLGILKVDEYTYMSTKNLAMFGILKGVCGIIVTSLMLYGNNHKHPEQGVQGVRLGPGLFLPYSITVYLTYGFYLGIFYSSFGVPHLMPYIIPIIYVLYFFEIYFRYIVTWRRKEMLPTSISETDVYTSEDPTTISDSSV